MSQSNRGLTSITRYIKKLRGGSQPILAEASDGRLYVVKFFDNPQGANLMFNESMGVELYDALGLPSPAWTPLLATDSFLDVNPACWLQTPKGPLRPTAGLCFGSRYLGGNEKQMFEILPGSYFKRVTNHKSFWLAWLVDICARHADNRQAIFLQNSKGQLDASFIDHGHLFGGPKGGMEQHFLASRYLDPRIYQNVSSLYLLNLEKRALCLDGDRLWKRIQELPSEWTTTSATKEFAQCLNRLSKQKLLQNIVDTMVDTLQKAYELECSKSRLGLTLADGVLHPRVSTSELEDRFARSRFCRSACA